MWKWTHLPLCFTKMQKFKYFSPLFCENVEINASPPVFATMWKWTHLSSLFFKNAKIQAFPPSVLQKCGN
jgi:hypothetical protein